MSGVRWVPVVEGILRRSPIQVLARAVARYRLRVLAYHGVPVAARFAAQADWLADHTAPVSLERVSHALATGRALPERAVLVTFDDGERSVLEVAAPILHERGIPAVAFVVAGLVDTDKPFWWCEVEQLVIAGASATGGTAAETVRRLKQLADPRRREEISALRAQVSEAVSMPQLTAVELRVLEEMGIAVGNHSLTHPCLDRCTEDMMRREIREAHDRLTSWLGHAPAAFAYPNGNQHPRVRREVADAGYQLAFAFDHRLARLPVPDPLAISRVRVDAAAGIDRFAIRASGLHPWLHAARGGQ